MFFFYIFLHPLSGNFFIKNVFIKLSHKYYGKAQFIIMSVYENVSFTGFLPDENFSEIEFSKLVELKEKIDFKLRSLEAKIKMANFTEKIIRDEKSCKHIKGAIYFSPMNLY